MRIFLSHINEEKQLAVVLKDWIESSFPDALEVFVSSDIRDIAGGDRWLEEINEALEESGAFIVLCSPGSVSRPWINFETGAAWIKRVPVIPVCHSGQAKSALPRPLSEFQALETDAQEFVEDLVASLGKHLGLTKVPRIDGDAMLSDMNVAIGSITYHDQPKSSRNSPAAGLDEMEVEVLQKLAEYGNQGATLGDLASVFGTPTAKMEYYLDELQGFRYVSRSPAMVMTPSRYRLRPEGRKFLVEQGLL